MLKKLHRVLLWLTMPHSWIKLFKLLRQGKYREIILRFTPTPFQQGFSKLTFNKEILILATPHTRFVAELLKELLDELEVPSRVLLSVPANYGDELYIIICPQMFECLPENFIAFQMEQSVSSRWFTESYFEKLHKAKLIFDYTKINVEYLERKKISTKKIFYLPLGYSPRLNMSSDAVCEKVYDVLFYGDINNKRRAAYLNALGKEFNVRVIGDTFGNDLYSEIRKARVVVNIHYYKNALLETTRIFECLSLGTHVVSEMASNQSEYEGIDRLITFVKQGDIPGMVNAIKVLLRAPYLFSGAELLTSFNFSKDYLKRALLATGIIDYEKYFNQSSLDITLANKDLICLSLPESSNRRRTFELNIPKGVTYRYFNGLKHEIGWVGCGLSYLTIFKTAYKEGLRRLVVCEDDVLLPKNTSHMLKVIHEYLDSLNDDWDIFCGLLTDVSDDVVLTKVEKFMEVEFIHLDKMNGMVFNIYNRRFFEKVEVWDFKNVTESNTIDRFIERIENLKVVTCLPFFAGHRSDLSSTLWGIHNFQYDKLIETSVNKLKKKAVEFKVS